MNNQRYKDALYDTPHVTDLRDLMNQGAALYERRAAYLIRSGAGGSFTPVHYGTFRADVTALGAALMNAGYLKSSEKGADPTERSKIAIVAENCYEYIVIYFAVVCGGGIIVPIDPRLTADEIANLIGKSNPTAVFHSARHRERLAAAQGGGDARPAMESLSTDERMTLRRVTALIPMDEVKRLVNQGKKIIRDGNDTYFNVEIDPHAACSILFTSGTMGAAKGVMLSQANLMSNVRGMSAFIRAKGMTALSVLPMHHTLEFTCDILAALYQGCTVAICAGLKYVMRDLVDSRAEVVIGVPLVFEKMHNKIMKTAKRSGRYELLRGLINFVKLSEDRFAGKMMFKKVHKALGGRVKLFLVGGAACDPMIISDFNAMGIRMVQGYGMTESAPIISVGKDRCSKDASVGFPLGGLFVQIEGVDANGVGEIIVSGPSIMLGYYMDDDATRRAMPDGRLHTGDLGYFDSDGFLYITGRKKNMIVLKSGKNIYPEEVESLLLASKYICEAVVSGEPSARELRESDDDIYATARERGKGFYAIPGVANSLVCAEVFPDFDKIASDFGSVFSDDVLKIVNREVERINQSMAPHMRVTRISLRDVPFDKTSTKKIKR